MTDTECLKIHIFSFVQLWILLILFSLRLLQYRENMRLKTSLLVRLERRPEKTRESDIVLATLDTNLVTSDFIFPSNFLLVLGRLLVFPASHLKTESLIIRVCFPAGVLPSGEKQLDTWMSWCSVLGGFCLGLHSGQSANWLQGFFEGAKLGL